MLDYGILLESQRANWKIVSSLKSCSEEFKNLPLCLAMHHCTPHSLQVCFLILVSHWRYQYLEQDSVDLSRRSLVGI